MAVTPIILRRSPSGAISLITPTGGCASFSNDPGGVALYGACINGLRELGSTVRDENGELIIGLAREPGAAR